jgi:hypothetical protein
MVQTVSRLLLTAQARLRARVSPCGICGEQSGTGQAFLRVLRFSLSVSFRRVSLLIYIYHLGKEIRPIVGSSSETQSHAIDIN